ETVADLPTGPKRATSTLLSIEEEAIIVAFRRHTLLSLDDCLYALQPTIPHLTRSSLHRCLKRHGISRLPEIEGSIHQTMCRAGHTPRIFDGVRKCLEQRQARNPLGLVDATSVNRKITS